MINNVSSVILAIFFFKSNIPSLEQKRILDMRSNGQYFFSSHQPKQILQTSFPRYDEPQNVAGDKKKEDTATNYHLPFFLKEVS